MPALKRIRVDQLLVGMYVEEICGPWMNHPFWRTSFLLSDAKDLSDMRATGIREVPIDTRKGLDVAPSPGSGKQPAAAAVPPSEGMPRRKCVSADGEIERAARICNQSTQAVRSMFDDVRLGHSVDVHGIRPLVQGITDSVRRNPGAIVSLARLKNADEYTYMHSVAVCAMMVALAKQLQLDKETIHSAGLAGLLHDLGKAHVPSEILHKAGPLTAEEAVVMRKHAVDGHEMLLSGERADPIALDVCLGHHEKWNGSGYPMAHKGNQISLHCRMAAVCDVYDAITSHRCYKVAWDPAQAMCRMAQWSDGHFDPRVFEAFVKSVGIYPVGSLVQLSSGRIGVVIEQGRRSLTTPKVNVFYSTRLNMRIMPLVVDLSAASVTEKIASLEDPRIWKFKDLDQMWSGNAGI